MSQVVKRPCFRTLSCHANQELIVKTGYNQFSLSDFYIYNTGVDVLEIVINNSDEILYISPDEYYSCPSYMEVYSCVTLNAGDCKYGGLF